MARLKGNNGGNSPDEFQLKILGRSTPFYANSSNPFYTKEAFTNAPITVFAKSGNDITITIPSYTANELPVGGTIDVRDAGVNTGRFIVKSKTSTTVTYENAKGEAVASPNAFGRAFHIPFVGGYAVKCIEDGQATITQTDTAGATHTTEDMEADDIEFYSQLTSFVPSSGKFKIFLI